MSSTEDDGDDDDIICRICFQSNKESLSMKLIKPCNCNDYVHLVCLNQWRRTSMTAYYQCTTCQYKYQLQRNIISEMIMSDNGVTTITLLLLLIIVVLTGMIIHTITTRNINVNTARLIYEFLQINIDSLFRPPWYYRYNTNTWEWYFATLCNQNKMLLLDIIDPIIIGSSSIGSVGLLVFVYKEMERAINIGGNEIINVLIRYGIWIGTLNHKSFGRLAVSVGIVMAYHSLFKYMESTGKKIAQVIGENILEPSRLRNNNNNQQQPQQEQQQQQQQQQQQEQQQQQQEQQQQQQEQQQGTS